MSGRRDVSHALPYYSGSRRTRPAGRRGLLMAEADNLGLAVRMGTGGMEFAEPIILRMPWKPGRFDLADWNEDGVLNLAVSQPDGLPPHPLSLLLGDPAGGFGAAMDTLQDGRTRTNPCWRHRTAARGCPRPVTLL